MSKRVLGKGIEALLHIEEDEITTGKKGAHIVALDLIHPNPDQPRKNFNEESLNELADSIRQKGVIQPIIVEENNEKYTIIAGERRYRASILAEKRDIPVIIRKTNADDKIEIALIENIQRDNLNPIEEAKAFRYIMDLNKISQEDIAKKVGKKRSTIANSLRLLKLPEEMQKALIDGKITSGHARALLSVTDIGERKKVFNRIVIDEISVREAEAISDDLNNKKESKNGKKTKSSEQRKTPEMQEFEQDLINALGTKVTIKGNNETGKIEIFYYSMDDLERIYEIVKQ